MIELIAPLFLSSLVLVNGAIDRSEWPILANLTDKFVHPHRAVVSSIIQKAISQRDVSLNPSCEDHLYHFSSALMQDDAASRRMLDSFTRKRAGQLHSILFDLGNFDQCSTTIFSGQSARLSYLKVDVEDAIVDTILNDTSYSTRFKRFLASTRYVKMLHAVCLPCSCSHGEINSLVNSKYFKHLTSPLELSVESPTEHSSQWLPFVKQLCKLFLLAVISVNILATYLGQSGPRFIRCFDIKGNLAALKSHEEDVATSYISKLKVVIMIASSVSQLFMPVVYHALYSLHSPMSKVLNTTPWLSRWFSSRMSPLIASNVMVSSIQQHVPSKEESNSSLLSRVLMPALKTVPVMLTMMCTMIILPEMESTNPLAQVWSSNVSATCFENGIYDLLFISNYLPSKDACIHQAWVTSIPLQLSLFLFPLLVTLGMNTSTGRASLGGLFLAYVLSMVDNETTSHSYLHPLEPNTGMRAAFIYVIPYLLGASIASRVTLRGQLSAIKAIIFSLTALSIYAASFLSPSLFSLLNPRDLLSSFITPLFLFTLFLALWSFESIDQPSKIMNLICQPLSRLYVTFILVQPLVTTHIAFTFYQPLSFLIQSAALIPVQLVFGVLAAFVLHILVEAPVERMIQGKPHKVA